MTGKILSQGSASCSEARKGRHSLAVDQEAHMKKQTVNNLSQEKDKTGMTICELDLEQDEPILCTPAGDQWRIVSVDEEKISFEKLT